MAPFGATSHILYLLVSRVWWDWPLSRLTNSAMTLLVG